MKLPTKVFFLTALVAEPVAILVLLRLGTAANGRRGAGGDVGGDAVVVGRHGLHVARGAHCHGRTAGTGYRHDPVASRPYLGDQDRTRVAHRRSAGVADQCHPFAARQPRCRSKTRRTLVSCPKLILKLRILANRSRARISVASGSGRSDPTASPPGRT